LVNNLMTGHKQLSDHVSRFRRAVNDTDWSDTRLAAFPNETCDVVCRILGLYLFDNGIRGISIMSGRRPDGKPGQHHWLDVNGVVVDITADQFGQPSIIVTGDSPFHDSLGGSTYIFFDDAYYRKLMEHYFSRFTRETYYRVRGAVSHTA